jgi:hypothetical protein
VEWAAENIRLQPPLTKTGPFDCSGNRHWIPVFDALQNDGVREVNVLKPIRGGGSLIGDVFCPWTICNDPGPYMDIFQTEAIASEHAEERIKKIFEHCPPMKELLPTNRHKERDDEILFNHGHTWYVRGPALANLQAKGIRYLRLEEVWMWPQGRMNEALGRIGDYLKMQTSKVLVISQGGPMAGVPMEESDWYRHYQKAQISEWEVQCGNAECGRYFDPVFAGRRDDGSFWGMTWDPHKSSNGDWDPARCIPTLRFECPHCRQGCLDTPAVKAEWNRTGRYRQAIPAEPGTISKRESFHWETVIDFPWDELVQLWLDACNAERRGDLGPKVQFYQKRRAMFRDEESLMKGGLAFKRTAYEINSAWPEEKARFLTVDRQEEDLFWWTARAWSTEESRKLGFGKCYGFAAVEEKRKEFKVEPNCVLIDSAYAPKGDHGVYSACIRYGWIAIRGDKEWSFVHKLGPKKTVLRSYSPATRGDPEMGPIKRFAIVIRFSKPQMNAIVQRLIEQGRWVEPANSTDPEMEKEYSLQMSSRVKKVLFNKQTGETRTIFKESKNDHARDNANGQALGAVLRELLPDPASERLTPREEGRTAENAEIAKAE